jgi:preprotein translocase subunit SecD
MTQIQSQENPAQGSASAGIGAPSGYPAGYGYAPVAANRSRKPILLALGFVGLLVVLAAGAVLVVTAGHKPTVSIVYQLVPADGQQVTTAQLDATVTVLRGRLNSAGIDGTVEKLPPDQVSVGVVKAADLTILSGRLTATGKLSFVLLPGAIYGDATTAGDTPIPAAGAQIDPSLPAQFTGADLDLSKIYAAADPYNPGYWLIHFAFTGDAGTRFATWSGQHVNEFFAIVLDQEVQSVPYIQSQITGGEGEITGAFTEAEAKSLAAVLQSGQLPVPLREISRTAAPSA